jgi:formate dehydrogenase maturation protein FdhE
MHRNDLELRHESRQRELSELASQRPELGAWLLALRVSLNALTLDAFRGIVPICSARRAPDAPLLHDAIIPVNGSALRAHVHAVLTAALGRTMRPSIDVLDAAQVLELAIAQDVRALSAIASEADMDAHALNAVAQLAAMPILIACTRAVAAQPLQHWSRDYCHVCGALPALAEVLGLERARHLRCARCGASWKTQVLLCAFCGERDHARLGSLVPDGQPGQIAWVETCSTCQGYLKTRAALRAAAAENVLIEDARTLELDLVATERGYQKPAQGAYPTRVRLTPGVNGVI